ncbi:uncharacterized protein LOC144452555 [Glandiceps talaboti]
MDDKDVADSSTKDPSNKVDIIQRYSEASLRIDLKSRLREYNTVYHGKAEELAVKEERQFTVVEGILKIYWGLKRPINLKKEQMPWKRRSVRMAFENGLEEKLMEAMGEASKRSRNLLKDSQTEMGGEEDIEEETTEVEIDKEGKNTGVVKQEKVKNKESGKGKVVIKTDKNLRSEKQNLESDKDYVRETEEVDKGKGAYKKEKHEVKKKKNVTEEREEVEKPGGVHKQVHTKKSSYSTTSTHVQSSNSSSTAQNQSRFLSPDFGKFGNFRDRTRDFGRFGNLGDRANKPEFKNTSNLMDTFDEDFDDFPSRIKDAIPRSKSMVEKSRPKTEIRAFERPNRSKSLRRRSRKTSFSGHFYNQETASFTPMHGSVTNVRVASIMTTAQVIDLLLKKFAVENRSEEFMLYKVKDNGETAQMKMTDFPLLERVNMGPNEDYAKIYLMEKSSTTEITHEVAQLIHVDLPVLRAILDRYKEEEEKKVKTLKQKYEVYRKELLTRIEASSTEV